MEQRNFTQLLRDANYLKDDNPKEVSRRMDKLFLKNKKDLEQKGLPNYLRVPTAQELELMRQFAIDYKKENKNASKRAVRKATQKKFHIKIFK